MDTDDSGCRFICTCGAEIEVATPQGRCKACGRWWRHDPERCGIYIELTWADREELAKELGIPFERPSEGGQGFQGGQGRSAEEVEASALLGGVALLGLIAILVMFWLCGLLGG